MIPLGRGAIAHVQYTGDEAANDINKLLHALVENEDDFDRWEALVTRATDLEGGVTRNSNPSAIDLVRNVYDCFLAKFPLFYGYWKKYADLEFSIGGTETAEMVYERGVSCNMTSVDLWANYCSFKMDTSHDSDVIRELFERAAGFLSLDFSSHPFWDKYIEFEERSQEPRNVLKLWIRAFSQPSVYASKYWEKFAQAVGTHPIEDLVEPELLDTLQKQVNLANQGQPEKAPLELERQIRLAIYEHYGQTWTRIQAEVSGRWTFEQEIKRPYFHVTELEQPDLDNWHKYLDFEEKEGDFERTAYLYERCLSICALYEEYWLRYVRWMFAQGKDENTRIIYNRASCIFVSISSPTIRLNWARFEEKLGRTSVARDIYISILEQAPGHHETLLSLANIERRQEGNDAAVRLLEEYISQTDTQTGGVLAAEQVRILWQCKGATDEARSIFQDKHERFAASSDFWLKYLEFEVAQPSTDQEESHKRVKNVYNLAKRMYTADAKALARYYMDFLMKRGGKDAAEEYMQLDKEVNGYVSSAKSAAPSHPQKRKGQPHSAANKRHRN
ncbi:hypothetical protein ACEQ8H_000211 [Pleosporales sp. CAS-2024a]